MKDCERCKYSYVDETGAGVYLRCYLKKQCPTASSKLARGYGEGFVHPGCESFEEEKNEKDSKGDDESVLRLIFEKRLDIPQFLKSSCANGYNCYIRATYNWDKRLYEKLTLTDEEFDEIKEASRKWAKQS